MKHVVPGAASSTSAAAAGGRRRTTAALAATGCIALASAALVGVADNPPGIALLYLGVALGIGAAAGRWRRTRSFVLLLIGGVVGFPVLAVLHNLCYGLAELSGDGSWLRLPLEALHSSFFIGCVVLCPPAVLVGVVGAVVCWLRSRRVWTARPG